VRILVTGAAGMLGRELRVVLASAAPVRPDLDATFLGRADLDITDATAVKDAVAGRHAVINAAAWTDVDGAETGEAAATAVNGGAVGHLATACAAAGAVLIHPSTDYVFAGDAGSPYPEDAPTDPVNAYGRSKLAGERAIAAVLPQAGYIVRTAWLYGRGGRNFVSTMLRLAGEREHLDVVDDQRGQPTWARPLAVRLVELATAAVEGRAPAGVYHGTASGETTWYGLAREIFRLRGLDPERVRPVSSSAFPRPARRPAYSVLGHDGWARAGLGPLAHWRDMLATALPTLETPA
jgi:dTDP-4-dehydrorhamnose reductase